MNSAATTDQTDAKPGAMRIVGVGASAGGLAALEAFFRQTPPLTGLAYLVVQHLDPTRKAMLAELLQRVTPMPVREAVNGKLIEPNCVYVIAPNTELSISNGALHLDKPSQPRGVRLPINILFSSLAISQGERAIAVVLSGMGSDGTLGLQAVKAVGGLTLAQQSDTAQFDSMPASAVASGCVGLRRVASTLLRHPLSCPASFVTILPDYTDPRKRRFRGKAAAHRPIACQPICYKTSFCCCKTEPVTTFQTTSPTH